MRLSKNKLPHFLNEAVTYNVIDNKTAKKLITFSQSDKYKQHGWATLSNILGGTAAFTIVLGIILMLASNWQNINDTVKFVGLLTLMGSSHYIGLKLHNNGYEKLSIIMHTIGCGLIYAGIGLASQTFNLHGTSSGPFIVYSILALPMAVILKSELLIISVFLSLLVAYHYFIPKEFTQTYSYLIAVTAVTCLIHVSKISYMNWIKGMSVFAIVIATYLLGFSHEWHKPIAKGLLLDYTTITPLFIIWTCWLVTIKQGNRLLSWMIAPTLILLTLLPILGEFYSQEQIAENYEYVNKFGRIAKLQWDNYFITLVSWLSYFSIVGGMIYHGSRENINSSVNIGIVLLGIGIYTRFIDLIGTMMSLGQSFIILGLSFLLIAYKLEEWRKNLLTANKETS